MVDPNVPITEQVNTNIVEDFFRHEDYQKVIDAISLSISPTILAAAAIVAGPAQLWHHRSRRRPNLLPLSPTSGFLSAIQ